jgi:homoserine kinase
VRATVRVPASVANLGPGFDMLALAIQLQNEVFAEPSDGGAITVAIDGAAGAADAALLEPAYNLVARAYLESCARLDVAEDRRGVHLRCVNAIPVSRGLGSSAAATLSGVLVAVALHGAPWDERLILECAAGFEGHTDNVAAALHGGLVICAPGAAVQRVDVPDELHAVVFAPQQRLATRDARRAVATNFTREDAIFNAARCALLVRALLLADYGALREAMDDRWHQAQRAALFAPMAALIEAAYRGGADGACLAGAGPSILALCARDPSPVETAMRETAAGLGVAGVTMRLRPRNFGARVEVRE